MILYHAKLKPLPGTDWKEVAPQARKLLREIARHTKRRPYIRSAYFQKDKIFFSYFWQHLAQKPYPEKVRRLKYLPCAIELIRRSRHVPESKENVDRRSEILHRFGGQAPDGRLFYVQIKEEKRTSRKELMSIFPRQQ